MPILGTALGSSQCYRFWWIHWSATCVYLSLSRVWRNTRVEESAYREHEQNPYVPALFVPADTT